ncbi:GGDEF domain-containing protein [Treponema sp. Marseille-Q4130]|uniref:GGDEF domain-containing protein n=1 Tax=Treponema sp. Marseille-Q4130 TaxID=2766702 RepID=UPI00165221DF|nr:GGDEF domain-containing protein [Treponema sp. Marseille-Q4130]MBC6720376.1 GGDEF domain-containing protein [Treponema sp. Marseille-Q4130]
MKRKSITVYSIVISAVFAAAIIFLCYKLGYEYATGRERTGRTFDGLAATTRSALSRYGDSSPDFRDAFVKACGTYDDYAFITLKNTAGMLFSYPQNEDPSEVRTSRFCEMHSSSFQAGDDTYILSASMYLIRPVSVFYYARFSFIVILTVTVFTLVLLLYLHFAASENAAADNIDLIPETAYDKAPLAKAENGLYPFDDDLPIDDGFPTDDTIVAGSGKKFGRTRDSGIEEDLSDDERFSDDEVFGADKNSAVSDKNQYGDLLVADGALPDRDDLLEEEKSMIQDAAAHKKIFDGTATADNAEKISYGRFENDAAGGETVYIPPETPFLEEANESQNDSADRFSPLTGFGRAHNLEARLDGELIRAASSERDLSLFMIRIPNLSFASNASKRICAYLFERFQSNDLLFEYMTDGFSIIKLDTTVDGALEMADGVREDIVKIIKGENMETKCAIGISSRSVRMLPGKRLIQEASEALENALRDDTSPIVAFRADADKYRRFIEERQS